MRGRKRLRSPTLAGAKTKTTFDLTQDYIGGRPTHSAPIAVDNPHDVNQKIIVFRKLRDDPLASMHSRGEISEAQFLAGRKWQEYYELLELSGAKGIDTTRDAVDGGQIARSSVTDAQAAAMAKLAGAAKALGMIAESVVRMVLVQGMTAGQVSAAMGFAGDRRKRHYSMMFQDALTVLAIQFGYLTSGPESARRK